MKNIVLAVTAIIISACLYLTTAYAHGAPSFKGNEEKSSSYSIFLVRHAEKQADTKNPSLTQCGELRANQLASTLSLVPLVKVYSTAYQRTMQTAQPTAELHELPIKQYAPNALEQFAFALKQKKENVLVVGHSNTTPQLAALLTGRTIGPLSEKEYQMLYHIQFINNQVSITTLKQPLECR